MKTTQMKKILPLFIAVTITSYVNAQISGNVYRDVNNNGGKSVTSVEPYEKGVFGVTVKAYNSLGVMVASVTTNANGDYSMPSVTGFPVRLEFSSNADDFSAKRNAAGKTNVQFIKTATTAANYGIASHNFYASGNTSYTATNAASNGNALSTGAADAGVRQNLIVFNSNFDNTQKTGAVYQNQWLGSVFGLTYQKETRTLLMAAYLKRHAGFGPGGIDAIYKSTLNSSYDATQPSVLFNLSSLGINAGSNPRTTVLPSNSATPNNDPGVFDKIGKIGIGNIDLADNGSDLYVTNLFENKIHRINIGMPVKSSFSSADVTGNWSIPGPGLAGTEWHLMSVKYYQGMVYVGGVASKQRTDAPQATQVDLDADHVNLKGYVYALNPATGSITQLLEIPFNYRRGNIVNQFRFEYKTNWWRAWQNSPDADVIRNDFNDAMEVFPQPAAPFNTTNNTGLYYAQPMLSDIEFDVDGSMILGIRDRFGDQMGINNYLEGANGTTPTSSGQLFRAFAIGEILRAGRNGTTWILENNASVTSDGSTVNTNTSDIQGVPPAAASSFSGSFSTMSGAPYGWNNGTKGFGPGGRYYYYNHAFTTAGVPISNIQSGVVGISTVHYSRSTGGITVLPGTDEMISTSISPTGLTFSSGVIRYSNHGYGAATNSGNMTDQQFLTGGVSATGDPSSFGKANGIGDIEFLDEALPIEIGNRVWNDTDGDGIQDANENGVQNITVLLRSPGADNIYGNADDQTWTTITDADGNYYFDNTIVNDNRKAALNYSGLPANSGVLKGQSYRLEISLLQISAQGYEPSPADIGEEISDNDGNFGSLSGIGMRYYSNVNTSGNNYNYDFGLKPGIPVGTISLTLKATLSANKVNLEWSTLQETNTLKFIIEQSIDGVAFNMAGEKPAIGNSFETNIYTAKVIPPSATSLYYRIKLVDIDGKITYSNIFKIKMGNSDKIKVWPNPVRNYFNINFWAVKAGQMNIQLIDVSGRVVTNDWFDANPGINQLSSKNINGLAPGQYVLRLSGSSLLANWSQSIIIQ
jgi:hypothetical protein